MVALDSRPRPHQSSWTTTQTPLRHAVRPVLPPLPHHGSSSRRRHQQLLPPAQFSPPSAPPAYVGAVVGVVDRLEEQTMLKPLPRDVENAADDASLHNPLLRAERMSTGWMGVLLELEGVVIEATTEAHEQAWRLVAQEFNFPRPLGSLFRRIKGVRDEVVVTRVFNWTHNPTLARQVAKRKAEVYEGLLGRQPAAMLEARPFLETLKRYNIPVALVSCQPEAKVTETLARFNLTSYFDAVVTADDSGSAEVEYYLAYAAQRIGRPPMRCIVVGESNTSVEAAHELGMKCIVVTGNQPVYNFVAADLVVRHLGQLTFMNLKKLFGAEELVAGRGGEGQDGVGPADADELADVEADFESSPYPAWS